MNVEKQKAVKVSVIIPIYNAAQFMDKCILSVLNQSHSNIELLLINDGSSDDSAGKCEDFAEKDSRIRVMHQKNMGPAQARNYGLREASGEFICFVDSDDWLELNAIEKMLSHVEDKTDIIQCKSVKIYNNGQADTDLWKNEEIHLSSIEAMKDYICNTQPIVRFSVWAKLIRRSITEGLEFPDIKHGEDVVFNAYLIDKAQEIIYIPEVLYNFAVRDDSVSHTNIIKERIDNSLLRDDKITELITSKPEYSFLRGRAYWSQALNMLNRSCQAYKFDKAEWKEKVTMLHNRFCTLSLPYDKFSVKQRLVLKFYKKSPYLFARLGSLFI